MLTLLIWLLYCTEAVRNTLCEKVKFMRGPSNHRLALRGREPEAVTGKINRKYPVRLEPEIGIALKADPVTVEILATDPVSKSRPFAETPAFVD